MKTIYLDIMLNGRFLKQLKYTYCPLFKIDSRQLEEFVLGKMSWIKCKDFKIEFSNNKL